MHLHITPALIRDLAGYESRPDQTGIVLTPLGWDTDVYSDGLPSSITAITLDEVHAYMDGDELDDDAAEALATGLPSGDYRIPAEDGSHTDPRDGQDPRVVFPADPDGEGGPAWEGACWFDLASAHELIQIDHVEWRLNDARRQNALLVTEGGRYVCRTDSNWAGEFGETFTALTPAEAAEWMYSADPDLVTDAEQPPLMVAARAAATLTASVAAPEVPDRRSQDQDDRAWEVENEAATVVRDAAIIATLVRERVASDLRRARAQAARIVVRAADGNQSEAARRIGIAQQTMAQLIRD